MQSRFDKHADSPNAQKIRRECVKREVYNYPQLKEELDNNDCLPSTQRFYLLAIVSAINGAYKSFLASSKNNQDLKSRIITEYFWDNENKNIPQIAADNNVSENTVYYTVQRFMDLVLDALGIGVSRFEY